VISTYGEAVERIRSQDADDVQLFKQILSRISYVLTPLTVKEIQHPLVVVPGEDKVDEALLDESLLISVCAGTVAIDTRKQYNQTCSLYYLTVL
jgi:hypothetical protein